MTEVKLVSATKDHMGQICEWLFEPEDKTQEPFNLQWENDLANIYKALALGRVYMLQVCGAKLAGFVSINQNYHEEQGITWVELLFIARQERRKGYGKLAVEQLVKLSPKGIKLYALDEAKAFWHSCGFMCTTGVTRAYQKREVCHGCYMVRYLGLDK